MNVRPFIPKENPDLPDFYKIKLWYLDGRDEELELVGHGIENGVLSMTTHDDHLSFVPLTSVKRAEFDHAFNKVRELMAQDKAAGANGRK